MRARYGASPLHLLAHLTAFALAGWALLGIVGLGGWPRILLWLVGRGDPPRRAAVARLHAARPARTARAARGWANYVRIPAGISALLALVFFPVVCGKGERTYARVSGLGWEGYAARWLLASAALFAASAALYLLRSRPGSSS